MPPPAKPAVRESPAGLDEPSRDAAPSAVSASLESGDRECFHCKYKLSRKICGQPASEYYQQQVDPRGVCSHVEINPAVGMFVKGLVRVIDNDCSEETVKLLEDALRLGLAEDDAVFARLKSGPGLSHPRTRADARVGSNRKGLLAALCQRFWTVRDGSED